VSDGVTILIADDQELVRSGLRALIDRADDLRVVGEAADGAQAVRLATRLHPRVVLMDVRMPHLDGIEATRLIAQDPALSDVAVLILTTFSEDRQVVSGIRAGAAGFLLKDASPDELRESIRIVARGDALLDPAVTRSVLTELSKSAGVDDDARAAVEALTERERDVLRAVSRGLSNDQVAAQLFLSPATARTYVSRLLAKLHVRDRAGLVVIAYEAGLSIPGQGVHDLRGS
jgi:DNA-binding NarL/FixJ family response regulator